MTAISRLLATTDLTPLEDRINVKSPTFAGGATGNGTADESAAINAAIDASQALFAAGMPNVVYLPAGKYRYVTPHAPMRYPVSFVGDGHLKTVIIVDTAMTGDLFAWSDVWQGNAQTGTTFVLLGGSPPDRSGVRVSGLSIIGDRSTSNTQNVFMFYDRADFINFDDVHVWYVKGRGLYNGVLLTTTQSYMRESHFHNLRFNGCGAPGLPSVEFSSEGGSGTDATNEVNLYNFNVVNSFGPSLVIRNNGQSVIRYMNFFGARFEGNNADDLLQIGDATFAGGINGINFYGAQFNGAPLGKSAIHTLAPSQTAGNLITNVNFDGFITNCVGKGINHQAGRLFWYKIWQMTTTDTNLTVGPTSQGIGKITIDSGTEQHNSWTQTVDVSMNFNINMPAPLYGKPSIASGYHYTGNGTPEGAVTAIVGSTYSRSDGGTSTSFYVKETGTGNTGWIAK